MIKLPDVDFFNTDPQQLVADVRFTYESIVGRTIQQSSPEYLFITTMAYWIALITNQFNDGLKQNLLYYAEGDNLDHKGADRLTPRLEAQGASTTLQFTLVAPQTSSIVIPEGTRATADNIIYFATTETIIINPGDLTGSVSAISLQTGEQSNNIGIGEIATIVDPIAFVGSVSNTEISLGGRDRELDDAYRERIYNAPSVFSIAGPRDAYIYLAKGANSAIGEVTVNSPNPAYIDIYPLLNNGEVPNQAILDLILETLNENTVRPLADRVSVQAPNIVPYGLNVTYYVDSSNVGELTSIQSRVNQAIDDWILWQRLKIGRDINLTELHRRCAVAGAKRITIAQPTNIVIQDNQLAVNSNKTVIFGGLENE